MSPSLDTLMYWIGQSAVVLMTVAGVLEAGRKRFELFGIVLIAVAATLGDGSVRDLLLERPVFWVGDQTYLICTYLICTMTAALVAFFLARVFVLSARLFLIPDAAGLALFSVTGTKAALVCGTPWLVTSVMGVVTGVVGGILRDVLCNEEPLVFHATAAWAEALALIGILALGLDGRIAALLAGAGIFLLRVAAIR